MEWRCTNCGTAHARKNPPCNECGGMDFERVVVRLEWECDACGEPVESPHESCPNCGGTDFSRIRTDEEPDSLDDEVRVNPSTETQQLADAITWECSHCGKRHMRNSPPCSRCGNVELEKVPLDLDSDYGDEDEERSRSLELFGYASSTLSLAGLALAVLGGLVIMYGGFTAMGTVLYETTGRLPPSAWSIIRIGIIVGGIGAGIVLFDTRRHDISF
jgi:predicted  nucleic acid-binding Zn-ribbon protein